jgi:transcription elongation factor Elf1
MSPSGRPPAASKNRLFKTVEVGPNQYKIVLRCPNCGIFFELAIQKGLTALKSDFECPYCGVTKKDSLTLFEIIKVNSELDKQLNFYP